MNGSPSNFPPVIENTAIIEGLEIAFLADVSHLIKSIRNCLFTHKTLKIDEKFVQKYMLESDEISMSVLEQVIELKEGKELNIAPRVTSKKCLVKGSASFGKMSVDPAASLLSQEMAAAIEYCVFYQDFDRSSLSTALFCQLVGKWYDICTSRQRFLSFDSERPEKTKELKLFILEFMEFFATLKIPKPSSESKRQQFSLKPVQKGVCLSTKSIIWLEEELLSNGVTFFMAGRVTGDSVENYHSQMRQYNPNPTCNEFKRFSKALGITLFLCKKVKGSSYEHDETDEWLVEISNIKQMQVDMISEEMQDVIFLKAQDFQPGDFDEAVSLASLAGYILQKTIASKSKCKTCMKAFCSTENDEVQGLNALIDYRDNSDRYSLIRPTELANKIFHWAESIFRSSREDLKAEEMLNEKFTALIISYISKEFEFPKCHIEIIIRRFSKCRTYFWADYRDVQKRARSKKDIDEAAHASRTVQQMHSID